MLIRRLPEGRPVALARSACEACARPLAWFEMIPLLSALALRGRCRTCHAPIAWFHTQVELAAIAVAAWAMLATGGGWAGLAGAVLGWGLLALAWIDAAHRRLPDALTLPLLTLGLLVTALLDRSAMLDHAIGAILGYAAFRLMAWAYRALRHRDGLGQGDAKLLAAGGAWVGWQGLDQVVLLAAVTTIAAVLLSRGTRHLSSSTEVPFGPGLALAILIVRLHA